jgi:hypothetical protein
LDFVESVLGVHVLWEVSLFKSNLEFSGTCDMFPNTQVVKGQGVLSLPWAALSTCCLVFCCFAGACAVPLVSTAVVALGQAEPTDGTTCSQSAIWRRGHHAQASASIRKRAVSGECRRALVVECRPVEASMGPIAGQLWVSQHAMRPWELGQLNRSPAVDGCL